MEPSPANPPPSSAKPLLWLALGLAALLVALFFLLGESWSRWFHDP